MDKLIFLGTGSAAHLSRQLTSLCFVTKKRCFLIDCGDGMGNMRNLVRAGVKIEDINDVFITHRHEDHIAGMSQYLFLKMLEPQSHVRVYGPKEAVEAVKTVSLLTHDLTNRNQDRIDFRPMESGDSVHLDNIVVTGVEVPHGLPQSFAYSVEVNKVKVAFTGDMQPNDNFESLAQGAQIIIHECYGLAKDDNLWHSVGHSSAKDAGESAARIGAKHLFLTHLPARDFEVDPKQLVEEAKRYFSGVVTVAEDLMEVPFAAT